MNDPAPAAPEPGTVVLDLSDAGVQVFAGVERAAALAAPSPGYAVVDGDRLLTGAEARARARLAPRRTHHRFWHELDEAPLPRPFPRRWTHADLVHRHLADLRRALAVQPERVIAVVASDRGRPWLERLLGVAAAAGWPVAGLVDGAVAAAPDLGPGVERAWHLDLGLHRAVLAELRLDGGVARRRVLVAAGAGLVELERTWARFFARRMVRATRFDPLHSAASEQRLYTAMDGWLERLLAADETVVGLAAGGREHQIEVSRREVEEAAAETYRRIAALLPAEPERASGPLLLSARAARLPGLAAALEPLAGPAVALPAAAAAAGALAAAPSILVPDGDPVFVVRLPARTRGAA